MPTEYIKDFHIIRYRINFTIEQAMKAWREGEV
jgi:hypothetical protein